ncbi:AtpZ/AtpI family protein [Pseudooceanicola sp. CBS1P-1]|uniref:ATP synthase protein I n=1 Tax=Pseudooceanicola albus TaxID=2692189 RepID=A0A6L7G710_9RHOB|nr:MULTISPECIES: AtpZ/AtpI family protein [Pseudooceanicola]MBT9384752.1 AtpZ/AtpI family protein [Pseudooceanicola endophyticus]MXN18453.1 F0F1 ATP synthase subunit I [Pseudooceanicola albus]
MTTPENREKMAELDRRIAAAKTRAGIDVPEAPKGQDHYSAAQVGWRMVTELVAGLGIGFGIGYGLDWVFGTLPIMMLLFTLLGFIAGIKTMMRSAKELQDQTPGTPGNETRENDGD